MVAFRRITVMSVRPEPRFVRRRCHTHLRHDGPPKGAMMTHQALVSNTSRASSPSTSRRTTRAHRDAALPLGRHARVPAAPPCPSGRASTSCRAGRSRDPAPGRGPTRSARSSSPTVWVRWLATRTWTPVTCPRCARRSTGHRSCRRPCSPPARGTPSSVSATASDGRDRAAGRGAAPEGTTNARPPRGDRSSSSRPGSSTPR